MLYEKELGNPQGTSAVGSVAWSTEMLSHGTGKAAEPAVRADIEVPERKLAMTWRLRRGADLSGSISHTIEFLFKLPPDFAGGGILKVPGLWMKEGARTQAIPLTGLAAKATTGYFIIGLSATPDNIQLLKQAAEKVT